MYLPNMKNFDYNLQYKKKNSSNLIKTIICHFDNNIFQTD